MRKEIHLKKKDFKIGWYSGRGAGGQHRNKHQNCCRVTHIETGLSAQGTESRERPTNQRTAFDRLAKLILSHYYSDVSLRGTWTETIRNYHGVRNEVHDKASGLKRTYKSVVVDGDISMMVDARLEAMSGRV